MKNMIFSRRKRLFSFTDSLSELVSSGISLQKSLALLEKLRSHDARFSAVARFLHKSLLDGTKFSFALKLSPFLSVPDWYVAYITVAEECGSLPLILSHLKLLLKHERETHEKIISALIYPVIVMSLTAAGGFFSVFYLLPSFSLLFSENVRFLQREALRTMIFADFSLLVSFALLVLRVKKSLHISPCASVFRTMAFLSENAVPTLRAVSCAFAFVGDEKRVSTALLWVRERLLQGEKVADCFAGCFERAGFKKEAILLSENLSLSEETGRSNGFEKTARFLEEKQARSEKILLSSLQPLLLLLAALYIGLILKTTFLPYITQFGGLI